jgi:hypothetical protein
MTLGLKRPVRKRSGFAPGLFSKSLAVKGERSAREAISDHFHCTLFITALICHGLGV